MQDRQADDRVRRTEGTRRFDPRLTEQVFGDEGRGDLRMLPRRVRGLGQEPLAAVDAPVATLPALLAQERQQTAVAAAQVENVGCAFQIG